MNAQDAGASATHRPHAKHAGACARAVRPRETQVRRGKFVGRWQETHVYVRLNNRVSNTLVPVDSVTPQPPASRQWAGRTLLNQNTRDDVAGVVRAHT